MKTSAIDIRQIRIFIAVVQSGGFSAAQDVLGLAQSTISTEISSLETRLGYKLCKRGRSGFSLTPQGNAVMKEAAGLIGAISQFEMNVMHSARHDLGAVRMAIIDNLVGDPNCPIIDGLDRFHQRTEGRALLAIDILGPHEIEEGVRSGKIDLGVGIFLSRDRALAYHSLYTEKDILVCGKRHPLYALENDLEMFAKIRDAEKVVRRFLLLDDFLFLSDKRESVTAEVDHVEAAALLILAGHHIGFLPAHYAEQWIATGEMRVLMAKSFVRQSRISLVHRSNHMKLSPLTRMLVQEMMRHTSHTAMHGSNIPN